MSKSELDKCQSDGVESKCCYTTSDGSPCQHPASKPDGRCHIHTNVEDVNVGRPSLFEKHRNKALGFAEEGFDIKTIAQKLGVASRTLHNWLNNNPDFGWEFRLARPEGQKRRYEHCSNKISFQCDHCGSSNEKLAWKVKQNDHNFCDESCYRKWDAEQKTKNSGDFKYGSGWNEAKKREVRSRDGNQCVRCGLSNEDHLVKYDRQLHVHHIKKARRFNDPEARNDKSNLVTLCHKCHGYVEMFLNKGISVDFRLTPPR